MLDERADIAGYRFDTSSVDDDGGYFAQNFENHGSYRHYAIEKDGETW